MQTEFKGVLFRDGYILPAHPEMTAEKAMRRVYELAALGYPIATEALGKVPWMQSVENPMLQQETGLFLYGTRLSRATYPSCLLRGHLQDHLARRAEEGSLVAERALRIIVTKRLLGENDSAPF